MTKARAGRAIVAVLASYLAIAILVGAREQLLLLFSRNHRGALPLSYFVVDLISQLFYTTVAGYLCHLIAPAQPIAVGGLIGVGLLVGASSLVRSWTAEPPRYAIGLLVSYVPCVGIGWAFRSPPESQMQTRWR